MPTNLKVEARVREIEASQHGLISAAQARDAGMTRKAVRHRLDTGQLVRRHRGVYASPAVPETWDHKVMAAVLASGDPAFASHATAARLWGLPYRWQTMPRSR